jgi:hypothetical protein
VSTHSQFSVIAITSGGTERAAPCLRARRARWLLRRDDRAEDPRWARPIRKAIFFDGWAPLPARSPLKHPRTIPAARNTSCGAFAMHP